LALGWLGAAVAAFVLTYVLNRLRVRALAVYIVLGLFAWLAMHESGVHATITGVIMGFLTPARPFYNPQRFRDAAAPLLDRIGQGYDRGDTGYSHESGDSAVHDLQILAHETLSPLDRIEHKLHLWSSFAIIPLFALANAGVEVTGEMVSGALSEPVVLGIVFGLVIGKTFGILGATYIAVRSGLGRLPRHTTWRDITGLAMAGGIGFTVALFVANLAFASGATSGSLVEGEVPLIDYAKAGILLGSLIAGLLSYAFLRSSAPLPPGADARIEPPEIEPTAR
jgi:NhaA family Na+:H+ antiporter